MMKFFIKSFLLRLFSYYRSVSCARGGAMMIILIGIALFAALMYTVSRNMEGGSTTNVMSQSEARLAAASIIDYGRKLDAAFASRLNAGCSISNITFHLNNGAFAPTGVPNAYVNAASTTDCGIFESAGSNLTQVLPRTNWLDSTYAAEIYFGKWSFVSGVCVKNVGLGTSSSSCSNATKDEELVAILPFLTKEICREINVQLGIPETASDVPTDDNFCRDPARYFTGTLPESAANRVIGDSGTSFSGRHIGCYKMTNTHASCTGSLAPAVYEFYQVLVVQ